MNKISYSIEINKPVEEVWNLFHDETQMDKWLMGFDSMELIEGKEREVGSKYKLYFDENGKKIEMIETITAFEPNKVFANTMNTEMMNTETTMHFSSLPIGTKIEVESIFIADGVVANLMVRMGLSYIENRYKQSYQKLKELAESQ